MRESIVMLIVSIVEPINQWRDGGDIFFVCRDVAVHRCVICEIWLAIDVDVKGVQVACYLSWGSAIIMTGTTTYNASGIL